MSAFSVQKRLLSAIHVQIRGGPRVHGEPFELDRCVIAKVGLVSVLSVLLPCASRPQPVFDDQVGRCHQYPAVSVMSESQEFRGSPPRTMELTNIPQETTSDEPAAVGGLDINS